MSTKYITIKEASKITGKSIQTIRRMIKAKKVKFKKDKTPQGFNYEIDRASLAEYYEAEKGMKIELPTETNQVQEAVPAEKSHTEEITIEQSSSTTETEVVISGNEDRGHQKLVSYEPVKEFNETMQELIKQHGIEKQNLFRLIESFQNKVISLENKMKATTDKSKKWYQLW